MKITKRMILLACALSLYAFSHIAQAEVAIVVSSSSAISSNDAKEISRLFLGKSKSLGGQAATPLNQKGGTADAFNKALLNKSSSQVKAYWSKLVFTGKGTPPEEVGSDADVISKLGANPEAVGYIDAGSVTGDVKVLLKL